jgi:AcrR family transcriptional regulator
MRVCRRPIPVGGGDRRRLTDHALRNTVPRVQNVVPALSDSIEEALADRAVAERRAAYAAEARRLIDAAFVVMRREGIIDPQVRAIVQEAGLSNQAFYRHFASKDALLLAVLADGQRQLVAYVGRRAASTTDPTEQVHRWINGVMAQARDRDAAEATRPFACNSARLADLFPADMAASRAEMLLSLAPAVNALGGTVEDAELVRDLALARMNDAIAHRRTPSRAETQRLAEFCVAGIRGAR